MFWDINNAGELMDLMNDDGFVNAVKNVEQTLDDVNETMERVEKIEGDAEQAVREANEALDAVDNRLAKFDETIRLVEAKIEAGFSIGFLFFGLNTYLAGDLFLAAGLLFMGFLGISSLMVTVATMPQVRRLRQLGTLLSERLQREDDDEDSPATLPDDNTD